MSLDHTQPPKSLAIELREVARDASALIEVLDRGFNFSLPNEFPKDQLVDICKSLVQLPEGTAEGCRAPLDYARHRLPAIRREYIQSEELSARSESAPALTRGERFDLRLGTLIASVTTALDEYRRLSAEEAVAETKPEASVVPPEGAISDAAVEASNLDTNVASAQANIEAVTRPDSKPADDLKRQLRDVRGLNRLAFAEIRMPRVVVSWLRKSIDVLKQYPDLIRKTASGLRVGTDILGIGLERWHEIERDLGRFVVDQMHRTWDALDQVAEVLETRRHKGSVLAKPPDEFDLDEARRLILAGEVPPKSWWSFISKLDFSFEEELQNLAPLACLNHLQSLDLSGTRVGEVAVLAGLTNLQSLDLAGTPVGEVAALADLANLQSLDLSGTQVSDIAALAGLTNLQHLYLSATQVSEVAALAGLTKLQRLYLSDTQVSDVAALASLANLQSLDLSGTRVSDVAALAGLTELQNLDLSYTRLSDVAMLRGLTNLRELHLESTRVTDVASLKHLPHVKILGIRRKQAEKRRKVLGAYKKRSRPRAR